jgi:UDP-hydrolysing UDP-N-acetyl-D-glucosamine 2-epimerase
MIKNILVSISNRTNYSKLKPVLIELKKQKNINLKIILGSTIANQNYSDAYLDIKKDKFKIHDFFESSMLNTTHESMSINISLLIINYANFLKKNKIDLLLCVGDRFDLLGAFFPCLMKNIPIAHIQGGENSGSIDNNVRSILSINSNLHFVSTKKSKENLIKMGIEKKTIFNYGCPAVEQIKKISVGKKIKIDNFEKKYREKILINSDTEYALLILHPNTKVDDDVDVNEILNAISDNNLHTIIFYPNLDANSFNIEKFFSKFKKRKGITFLKHAPIKDFVKLMAHSKIMIGNSSSGIREAASFGIPVINIGSRQENRERNKNTFESSTGRNELKNLIKKLKNKRFKKQNVYYKPNCFKKISKEIIKFLQKNEKKN